MIKLSVWHGGTKLCCANAARQFSLIDDKDNAKQLKIERMLFTFAPPAFPSMSKHLVQRSLSNPRAKMPFCFLLVRHQRSDCTLVALANGDNAAALFAPGNGIGTNMLCSAISNIRQHEHVRCWRFWFCVPFNSATKMLSKHMYRSSVYRVNPIQSYAVCQF